MEPEIQTIHFILAAFMVIRPTHLRINQEMSLKEDYDYSVQHIKEYGGTLRMRQLASTFKNYKNQGGAVTYRTPEIEQENIERLRTAHPGRFRRGRNEYRPQKISSRSGKYNKSTLALLSPIKALDVYEIDNILPYSWIWRGRKIHTPGRWIRMLCCLDMRQQV